jgi:hypothetical protein
MAYDLWLETKSRDRRDWINLGHILYTHLTLYIDRSIEVRSFLMLAILNILTITTTFASGALVTDIVVYKNPECGCCTKWVKYLQDNNYNVTIEDTRDVLAVKKRLGVPEKLAACHTAVIEGYVVEGHITHRDIERLLLFRPDIKGIAVPGMPFGTPGMESGNTIQSYKVMSFDERGNMEVFAEH